MPQDTRVDPFPTRCAAPQHATCGPLDEHEVATEIPSAIENAPTTPHHRATDAREYGTAGRE